MTLLERAQEYAVKCHEETNHLYDGKPYIHHLQGVVRVALRFKHLIPPEHWEDVVSACWCHDVIEDTRQTYNDVKKATNEQVAELVYALTNEKGRNRKERANWKYYLGIKETPYATFVKLCDRIANVQYSIDTGSRMYEVYQREREFAATLYDRDYLEMFECLQDLLRLNYNCKPLIEEDLKNLIDDLCPAHKPMILHCGKGFVREFARQRFGGSYTFKQFLGLFRSGIIRPLGGIYEIRG